MKVLEIAGKTVKTLVHFTREYPIGFSFLILCVLLGAYFEIWDPLCPLPAHEWNATNLKLISGTDPDDFSFAVFGDNRNSKFVFENLLKSIDHDLGIAFAVSLGNIVSRGKKERYHFFIKQVKDTLGVPLLTTMGNRELKAKGPDLYHEIFGPAHYSFHIGKNYFIILDNVSKEGLDLIQKDGWLERELYNAQTYDTRFVFMHKPPYNLPEESSETLKQLFLKYPVTHIFTSHVHGYFEGVWNSIPYTISGGAGGKLDGIDPDHYFYHFLKVTAKKGTIDVSIKQVQGPDYPWLDRLLYYIMLTLSSFSIHLIKIACFFIVGCLAVHIYRSESGKRK